MSETMNRHVLHFIFPSHNTFNYKAEYTTGCSMKSSMVHKQKLTLSMHLGFSK
jgi:hypothetical protein